MTKFDSRPDGIYYNEEGDPSYFIVRGLLYPWPWVRVRRDVSTEAKEYNNKQIEWLEDEIRVGIRAMLKLVGDDPNRGGVADTPDRVVKAFKEMTEGLRIDPRSYLDKNFALDDVDEATVHYNGMIISKNLPLVSLCEHHLLPFTGIAHVGYIPQGDRVVGLSKLARVVEGYSRRPQVQERLTQQICDAIEEVLQPRGVAVVVAASHSCQALRGVKKSGTMVTSAMTGAFMENHNLARSEFLQLIKD